MEQDINFQTPQNVPSGSGAPSLRMANAGILFDAQNTRSRALLKGFLRAVKPLGIPLAILGFDKKKSALAPLGIPFIACTSDDFSLFGKIKPGHTAAFMQKPFDLLLDLSLSPGKKSEKICRDSAAHFKIGVNQEAPFYDFRFTMPAGEEENPAAFEGLLGHLRKIHVPQ